MLRGEALARELRMTEPMVRYRDNSTRAVRGLVANIGDRSFQAWSSGAGADSKVALLGGTPTSFSRSENMVRCASGRRGVDTAKLTVNADSHLARDSFKTFIPLSVDNDSRVKIIFDFFDLLAAIAAHSKSNGFGGRKLSRMAAWWAFESNDNGNGFEGGYKSWLRQVANCPFS